MPPDKLKAETRQNFKAGFARGYHNLKKKLSTAAAVLCKVVMLHILHDAEAAYHVRPSVPIVFRGRFLYHLCYFFLYHLCYRP